MRVGIPINMLIGCSVSQCSHSANSAFCAHVLIARCSTLLAADQLFAQFCHVSCSLMPLECCGRAKHQSPYIFQSLRRWVDTVSSQKNDAGWRNIRITDRKEKSMNCITAIAIEFSHKRHRDSQQTADPASTSSSSTHMHNKCLDSGQKGQSRDSISTLNIIKEINCQTLTPNIQFFPPCIV